MVCPTGDPGDPGDPALRPAAALVVVGASAGGVEALRDLAAGLPEDLGAAVLVVLHVPPTGTSSLPAILDRAGPLPARHAVDGDLVVAGEILVAPPDHHLLVLDGRVSLSHGPQENGHRPAVDVLFRSAARSWEGRLVAVVLSGSLDDGAAGLVAVTRQGGYGLVQDPEEALYAAMPRAAVAVADCEVLALGALTRRIAELAALPVEAGTGPANGSGSGVLPEPESQATTTDPPERCDLDRPGEPSAYSCPDCAGPLFAVDDGPLHHYRCRLGHAWSPESLLVRQSVALESALWMALRGLEEKVALNVELGHRARERGARRTAERFERNAEEVSAAADLVRRLVSDLDDLAGSRAPTHDRDHHPHDGPHDSRHDGPQDDLHDDPHSGRGTAR